MRRLDELTDEALRAGVHLRVNADQLSRAARGVSDGLFHVPLLALCILVIARAKKGTLDTADLAAWTGATLSRQFISMRQARRKLEWSLQHRRRCAEALVFLENVGLVVVKETPRRTIHCSDRGLELLRGCLQAPSEEGVLVRGLERAFRAAEQHGLELL